jgi:hypothetical protein
MRTKKLLLTAAVLAAGIISSFAQSSNVYSVNIVGYVNKPCPSGLSIIANPLNSSNLLSTIMSAPPDFSQVLRWNGSDFDIATFFLGVWDVDLTLAPGEGFFINASSAFTNTFVGDALTGDRTNNLVAGLNMKSSIIPIGGNADTLGLTAALSDFDQVLLFNNSINDYVIYTYFLGAWDLGAPPINVADGFFVSSSAGGSWVETLIP